MHVFRVMNQCPSAIWAYGKTKCENMLLYPHQPIGASVELQHADEMRSSLCMYSITCPVGLENLCQGMTGTPGTSAESLTVTETASLLLIEQSFCPMRVQFGSPGQPPSKLCHFHPSICTDMHVMWSEVHEEGGGWERRWIYMRSVRETRVFMFLHTCVFNVLPYIHTGSRTFNICPHYMDS